MEQFFFSLLSSDEMKWNGIVIYRILEMTYSVWVHKSWCVECWAVCLRELSLIFTIQTVGLTSILIRFERMPRSQSNEHTSKIQLRWFGKQILNYYSLFLFSDMEKNWMNIVSVLRPFQNSGLNCKNRLLVRLPTAWKSVNLPSLCTFLPLFSQFYCKQ